MMRWFSGNPTCPAPEESRQWVERRMAWIADAFGPRIPLQTEVVLPTPQYFPDIYDGTDATAETMFDRICAYAGIERHRVRLQFITARHESDRGGALFIQSEGGGAAGTYQGSAQSELALITLERSTLADPMNAVATMAHELCHVHLISGGKISPDEEDHEPLTDLLTVCRGFGIFGANASVRDQAWHNSATSGWSVSRLGYLRQETWGYALAKFASLRQGPHDWSKYLRADIRAAFKSSLRYISHQSISTRESC